MLNTITLAEDPQARTSLSARDAGGIVRTIAEAVDGTTSNLVTRDHMDMRFAEMDARFAEMDSRFAELRADVRSDVARLEIKISEFRAEFQTALRTQLTWIVATIVGMGGLVVALVRFV